MLGTQQITEHFVDDLKLLACYDPANLEQGIKLHENCATSLREAGGRLHALGMITEPDGGYLTPFGITMVEHMQHLITALNAR